MSTTSLAIIAGEVLDFLTSSFVLALEALTSWKDGKIVPSLDPQDLEAATEKTFGGSFT